ncbi:PIG-L family deacetylase [Actinomadura sp. NBRC 104412]|uniref:PIG-L family deacetylase n=1 Tax=Actinomadura sp. NBRC 104412 TaxID=3032203 RepID=UPI0025524C36|nr:PIG-L family deacetylase [Actinomadura sp. NBRC 104412]
MPRTCVFFHAHRGDETLLTAGTMARLAAEGHRVVLVLAATGHEPSCLDPRPRAPIRTDVQDAPAGMLGCARVVVLGYEDSGPDGEALGGFSRTNVDLAAGVLAGVLREEDADLLTVYDPGGGYGHPDHVHVHRVGVRAAELASTPVVLEATLDRDFLRRALRFLGPLLKSWTAPRNAYSARAEITHRVRVGAYSSMKRAAMAAHSGHRAGGGSVCASTALPRLPRPLFSQVMGTEWFVRRDLPPGTVLDHPLAMWPETASSPERERRPARHTTAEPTTSLKK